LLNKPCFSPFLNGFATAFINLDPDPAMQGTRQQVQRREKWFKRKFVTKYMSIINKKIAKRFLQRGYAALIKLNPIDKFRITFWSPLVIKC
jgi:hypothetical protein